jgi:hypothetical protein
VIGDRNVVLAVLLRGHADVRTFLTGDDVAQPFERFRTRQPRSEPEA